MVGLVVILLICHSFPADFSNGALVLPQSLNQTEIWQAKFQMNPIRRFKSPLSQMCQVGSVGSTFRKQSQSTPSMSDSTGVSPVSLSSSRRHSSRSGNRGGSKSGRGSGNNHRFTYVYAGQVWGQLWWPHYRPLWRDRRSVCEWWWCCWEEVNATEDDLAKEDTWRNLSDMTEEFLFPLRMKSIPFPIHTFVMGPQECMWVMIMLWTNEKK